ncbi:hypothetical protein Pcinc_034083 [Petrolisthes cinctipes]|uniref:Uncharacterized protein n=1 Tax=Petrolisthes cinctipes TaxID=88211 RepID=A0AAE1EQY3_PETCI|nr:hypothetical protein Pcinc_034083 [Petrolisthes cinctipes]
MYFVSGNQGGGGGVGWMPVTMDQVWMSLVVVCVMLLLILFIVIFTCCCKRQCDDRARSIEESISVLGRDRGSCHLHRNYGATATSVQHQHHYFIHHHRDYC